MNFKDIIKNDSKRIFLNDHEFAEKHTIDGKEMTITIDNHEMIEREKRYQALEDGVHMKQVLFFVAAAEFGRLPKIGRTIMLDGIKYKVTDAIREGAMYSIQLEANQS